MAFDFDRRIDRVGTASEKWDGLEKEYGSADLLPMWVADMEFGAPDAVVEALVERARHPIYGYTFHTEAVYEAIERWLLDRHGWRVERDWIRFGSGVVPNLSLVVRKFTRQRDRILIQPPVYYPFRWVIERQGRRVVTNPLVREGDHYRMDLDDLREKARAGARALVLCSPHNPVGRVWRADELRALGEVCEQAGLLVLADEIHSDLTYPGVTHTPYASLDERYARHSITFVAPSKTFNLAGLQTSVAIVPDAELRRRYDELVAEVVGGFGNVFGQIALVAAYRHGDAWLDELRAYLAANLAFLEDFIAREIPAIHVVPPEGTYLVWLDCRGLGMDSTELAAFMRQQAKVALDDGDMFGVEGAGYERINIACPRAMLAEALERIAQAVRRRDKAEARA